MHNAFNSADAFYISDVCNTSMFDAKYTRMAFFVLFIANSILHLYTGGPIAFFLQAIFVTYYTVCLKDEPNYIEILLPFYLLFIVAFSMHASEDNPSMEHNTWLRT